MPGPLIDTHAHLDDERFAGDLSAVLERAEAAGLTAILTIGIDLATSRAALALAKRYPLLRAVVGIQPNHVSEAAPSDWDAILRMVSEPEVVGIGESGLDRYWDRAPFELQETYFLKHLDLARQAQKPIVIHCREAEADVVRVLQGEFERRGPIRGVMHSYSSDEASVLEFLRMGLHISFAGMLTFKANDALRKAAARVPMDRVLVETDSPYLTPMPHRGKRNEPAYVAFTAACLAGVYQIPTDQLALLTTHNARALFGI